MFATYFSEIKPLYCKFVQEFLLRDVHLLVITAILQADSENYSQGVGGTRVNNLCS